jgi:hypothetical protein
VYKVAWYIEALGASVAVTGHDHVRVLIGFHPDVQIPVSGPDAAITTQTQVNSIVEAFELNDAKNPPGMAFALVQMWYYHFPVEEVRDPVTQSCDRG